MVMTVTTVKTSPAALPKGAILRLDRAVELRSTSVTIRTV
jgi:hypothetical protein